ncbi:uncharacterized protein LOC123515759 [Portunus trituberculatus]|uniref:uncharacterized protein LOC123515759 n=1 Tax=Portunus trituberculatus TaxID=210409 RepID=UPI001E1CDC3F|nr:uncharacterized protein LOC123515759 [Portunus trituberculatus]
MDERAYASPWSRANPMLQSPHLAQNTYAGHGSFPQFASASQGSPRLPESGSPYESSFFQCSTNCEGSQRQAVQGHTSIFQRANMNRDISEQMFMQSSQSPLSSSQPISSYGGSQNNAHVKEQETGFCNENYTSYGDVLPSSQPTAKRVPMFKAARAKASGIPIVPVKGKKRLVSPSLEEPLKRHSGVPLFTHSQKSAFKPVSKVSTPESASNSFLLPTPKKESCKNNDSGSQLKTQPLKPTFGKSHPFPSKKIKKETHSKLIHHKTAAQNDEGSDAALTNKTAKRSEIELGSQTDVGSHSSSQPIKDDVL